MAGSGGGAALDAAAGRREPRAETKEEKMGGVEERHASGKVWGVAHNTHETGGGLAGARGGTVGEDLSESRRIRWEMARRRWIWKEDLRSLEHDGWWARHGFGYL